MRTWARFGVAIVALGACAGVVATSPEWATTTEAVDRAPDLTYASLLLKTSGQGTRLDAPPAVTVFLPADRACGGRPRASVDPARARRFVLGHAFAGQITWLREPGGSGEARLTHIRMDGRIVSAGEGGSLVIPNLRGEPVRFSVAKGRLVLAGHAHLVDDLLVVTRTGSLGVIDDCGPW